MDASRSKLNSMGDGSGLVPRVVIRNTVFALFLQREAKISFCKSYKLAGSVTDVETSICTDADGRQALYDTELPLRPFTMDCQAVSMHIAMFLILF
jgi:hypothetical protein